jgi:hypothetical protein
VTALDHDDLGQPPGLGETGLLEDLVGPPRLTDVVLLVERLLTDARADHDRRDHERKPAEDRRLAMACAPATDLAGAQVQYPTNPANRLEPDARRRCLGLSPVRRSTRRRS